MGVCDGRFKEVKLPCLPGISVQENNHFESYLANTQGIRAAVIVNDIGEINVDAGLIRDGGYAKERCHPADKWLSLLHTFK